MQGRWPRILAPLLLLASCGGEEPPRLVLLASVDTLRADRLGAYGSRRGLTPNLDALAAESLVFDAAYAPSSHTLPSVAALLSGRYPEELGIWGNGSLLPAGTPTLAGAFRAAGFRTAAVVSNWVVRRQSGLDAGFEHYDDRLPQLEAARSMPERVAADTTDAALAALDACLPDAAARCFLWVHYQDPHGPYTPPAGARERHLARELAAPDGERRLRILRSNFGRGGIPHYQAVDGETRVGFYRAGYDAEVATLDTELGRLLDGLRARDLRAAAVVVFTADHGESLGEDDYWFGHGELLSEPLVRVPLFLRVPGEPPRRRADLASLVDLLPTLARRWLGAPADPELPGRDLLERGAEGAASTPYLSALRGAKRPLLGLVEGELKYLAEWSADRWHGRLVRRDDESADLGAAAPHVGARLREKLMRLHERYHRVDAESLQASVDERQLEALGYAEPSDERGGGEPAQER
jgi:arylsulfatase A-like enzyme